MKYGDTEEGLRKNKYFTDDETIGIASEDEEAEKLQKSYCSINIIGDDEHSKMESLGWQMIYKVNYKRKLDFFFNFDFMYNYVGSK